MKHKTWCWILLSLCLLSCSTKSIDFSYSPAAPRAGETILFANQTTKGDKWTWTFGDGSIATLRSPSKIYKKPGVYTVTLMVDSVHWKRVSKEITIYDTVPSLGLSSDSIVYMEEVQLIPLVYNPFKKSLTYKWEIPDCAVLTSGTLDSQDPKIYFNKHDTTVTIGLHLTLDNTKYDIYKEVRIYDKAHHGLYLSTPDVLYRQRLFDIGMTEADKIISWTETDLSAPDISQLAMNDLQLLLFAQGAEASLYSLTNDTAAKSLVFSDIIRGTSEVSHGYLRNNELYVTFGGSAIYLTDPKQNNQDKSLMSNTIVELTSPYLFQGNIIGYNRRVLFSSGNDIYYCSLPDLTTEKQSPTSVYHSQEPISEFALDAQALKLYIISGKKLTIANIDGTQPTLWSDDEVEAMTICQELGTLFYANSDGCFALPLVNNPQNTINALPKHVSTITGIKALTYDKNPM